ncbi:MULTISPECIES: ABC transporter ATP-binding protein [unclassified Clostridioides]|uniref:ABC transporter ATP-binding protein n=1 Tax=unclassified Clostridioides TaxID=2635829 RepID=UPI001D0CD613|nr:ABC transporter ATP-binding protein [Clostridioides sp. ES-S-0049-03]MCC0651426.1 ABC transporter ATP-binding protein [Clostridioides sp. ES-S-0001-03]MCC0655792.1 ABC transporter ATP-binding protein [Clostridioides sp. ES-S-0123-01]MCC0676543.1 ABC transporter ATP-binding protein [Clostridioides sp. ES-W-0018-02]MCC0680579.1 ABC transporter ATP-binding protein [Clostridioides sp. ES-S-0005-03]MCC0711256.1 ABC transporter ATP-binding protein [Clostridioides sp. ES-W-0017-02]UDN46797.1 ABC 
MDDILRIKELNVSFDMYEGTVNAVRGVSLSMNSGEILALVGESGCGKSVMAQSILQLNPSPPAKIMAEELKLLNFDILNASEKEMERIRGTLASMIFQDPLTCLNPTMKIGKQITESLYRKEKMSSSDCKKEAVRLLEMVQIPNAELQAEQYPHQFSGGMQQRVMIAMALACNPKLLIADEPTTALDVTTQLQILKLIAKIRKEMGTAVLLITHDFGVVANLADRVAVMYAGKIVEESGVKELFNRATHPYTQALLRTLPTSGVIGERISILGSPPNLSDLPVGCSFSKRCPYCMKICLREEPPLFEVSNSHSASCWRLHESFPKEELDDGKIT